MQYFNHCHSPIGEILLTADEIGLTGLWFNKEMYELSYLGNNYTEKDTTILKQTKEWLAIYFSGKEPDFLPPMHITGTPFRLTVWKILQTIPYGKTITYGEIAKEIARQKGISQMSAQAVGGAVGHNAISIIIPCHRVIGANGNLTGYGGGIDKKIKLLTLEKVDIQHLFIPPHLLT